VSPKYRLTVLVISSVLILDQITKVLVHKTMALYQSIELVPNFIHLTYLRNTGAAFGLLAGSRSALRLAFFTLLAAAAIVCIFFLLKNLPPDRKMTNISLSLILSGAIGNLIDRLRLGEVIDFIDLHWYDIHWPAFNVADSAITIGVILFCIQMVRKEQNT
jgi:signal peptidase II